MSTFLLRLFFHKQHFEGLTHFSQKSTIFSSFHVQFGTVLVHISKIIIKKTLPNINLL